MDWSPSAYTGWTNYVMFYRQVLIICRLKYYIILSVPLIIWSQRRDIQKIIFVSKVPRMLTSNPFLYVNQFLALFNIAVANLPPQIHLRIAQHWLYQSYKSWKNEATFRVKSWRMHMRTFLSWRQQFFGHFYPNVVFLRKMSVESEHKIAQHVFSCHFINYWLGFQQGVDKISISPKLLRPISTRQV